MIFPIKIGMIQLKYNVNWKRGMNIRCFFKVPDTYLEYFSNNLVVISFRDLLWPNIMIANEAKVWLLKWNYLMLLNN